MISINVLLLKCNYKHNLWNFHPLVTCAARCTRKSRDVSLHLGFNGIVVSDSCQKFSRRKCHDLTLGKILQISCDDIVSMNRFRSCTLNSVLEIFPFHVHGSFQNYRTKIGKFKNQIQLTKTSSICSGVNCFLITHIMFA